MNFNSVEYFVFFAVVLTSYWVLPRKWRVPLLLVASYVFYASLDFRFLALLWLTTGVDYAVARALGRETRLRNRQVILLVSILSNLAVLGFFKYVNFFYAPVSEFLDTIGFDAPDVALKIALPVGLSFYTFQSMSYTIDVYRRTVEPERNLVIVATYVAFFPQLLAGPIARARQLMPQLSEPRERLMSADVREGLDLILLGLFKKVVIADVVALLVTDALNDQVVTGPDFIANEDSWIVLLLGVLGFSLQLYGDFSGYSDIARGSAKLFGIELSRNFVRPFWSETFTELWRRWHVTMMMWFRDYLFIPLGGSRKGQLRTYRNLLIVFIVAGIWHAPTWMAFLWGIVVGTVMIIEAAVRQRRDERRSEARASEPTPVESVEGRLLVSVQEAPTESDQRTFRSLMASVYVFLVFAFTAVLFRFDSGEQAVRVFEGIVSFRPGQFEAAQLITFVWAAVMTYVMDRHQRWLDFLEDERRGVAPQDVTAAQKVRFSTSRRIWSWHVRDALILAALVIFSGGVGQSGFFYFKV